MTSSSNGAVDARLELAGTHLLDDLVEIAGRPIVGGPETHLIARHQRGRHGDPGGRAVLGNRTLGNVDVEIVLLRKVRIDAEQVGPPAQPEFRERTGIYTAIVQGHELLTYDYGRGVTPLRGEHGGWSAEEMVVPVLTFRR